MSRSWGNSSSMLWSPPKYLFYVEQYYQVPLCYFDTILNWNGKNSSNFDIEKNAVPCRRLSHINFDYSESPTPYYDILLRTESLKCRRNRPGSLIKNVSLDSFYVGLVFTQETYKEVALTKQFDLQSLIGNAGGYVGMCVGCSLLQLPQLFLNFVSRFKNADTSNREDNCSEQWYSKVIAMQFYFK